MNKKNLLVGLGLALVLALGVSFPKGNSVVNQIVGGAGGTGPDSSSPYVSNNGVFTYFARQALVTATTTPCAIATPSSTSTLLHASLQVTKGTTTDTTIWTLSKAATKFATTTKYGAWSLTGGLKGTMIATTTTQGAGPVVDEALLVIAPNQFLVWGVAGTIPGDTTNLTGTCQAVFRQI